MPSFRRKRSVTLPDYSPGNALRLADYTPRAPAAASDPATGYGFTNWGEPSKPLTSRQQTQVIGGVGTQFFAGVINDNQIGEDEPEEWKGDRRWRTIRRMSHDGQATAVTNVCLLPLLQATYAINPASDSDEDVALAQQLSNNLLHGLRRGWHYHLREFYAGRLRFGHSLKEKVWTIVDGSVELRKLAVRPPETVYRWFPDDDDELNRIMQRVWLQNENGVSGTWKFPVIPAEKLLLSTRNQEGNDFRGTSLYRSMWTHYDIKHKLYIIDGIAAERNGMGIPSLNEPEGGPRQASDRLLAAQALSAFRVGETAYMLTPHGYTFALQGVSGNVRNIMPSIEHHDLMMSRSALAQFLNIDSSGVLQLARDSTSFFLQSEQAESDEGVEAHNDLIREWCDLNYDGLEAYPTLAVTGIQNRDLDALLKGISGLFTSGALTRNVETENAIRDYLDFPALPADASPAGGGAVSVDPDQQGGEATAPGDAGTQVMDIGSIGDTQGLARKPPFQSGRLGERAIHLSGPPLPRKAFTVYMSGAYREPVEVA